LTLFFISVLILSITPFVNAEVWNTSKDISEPTDVFIPTHEYVGFFDSNDIYTVVGNVKNNLDYSVTPQFYFLLWVIHKNLLEQFNLTL